MLISTFQTFFIGVLFSNFSSALSFAKPTSDKNCTEDTVFLVQPQWPLGTRGPAMESTISDKNKDSSSIPTDVLSPTGYDQYFNPKTRVGPILAHNPNGSESEVGGARIWVMLVEDYWGYYTDYNISSR